MSLSHSVHLLFSEREHILLTWCSKSWFRYLSYKEWKLSVMWRESVASSCCLSDRGTGQNGAWMQCVMMWFLNAEGQSIGWKFIAIFAVSLLISWAESHLRKDEASQPHAKKWLFHFSLFSLFGLNSNLWRNQSSFSFTDEARQEPPSTTWSKQAENAPVNKTNLHWVRDGHVILTLPLSERVTESLSLGDTCRDAAHYSRSLKCSVAFITVTPTVLAFLDMV